MKLPKITTKQQDILKLLYRYRFLNRIQIQSLMGHKDYRRINAWLKDLREKHYIEWIYSSDFHERRKPAIYYLGLNGVRYLRSTNDYPLDDIRKRYKDSSRSQTFMDRCLLIADCSVTLKEQSVGDLTYEFETQTEFTNRNSPYHFLSKSDARVHPQLAFTMQEDTPDGPTITSYLLDVFDTTLPRYRVKKRLKEYAVHVQYGEWGRTNRRPIILLVCPTKTDLIYGKRRSREDLQRAKERSQLHIRFTTVEELKKDDVTGDIWEEVYP